MKTSLGVIGVGGTLAIAALAIMPAGMVSATESLSAQSVQIAAGEEIIVYRRVISVEDGGKAVTFRSEDGRQVVKAAIGGAKLSQGKAGKRKPIQAAALKEGMVCEISYAGDKASKLECDPEEDE